MVCFRKIRVNTLHKGDDDDDDDDKDDRIQAHFSAKEALLLRSCPTHRLFYPITE
jgi:hypothetical protein